MWQKQNLCKEYQSLVTQFADYATEIKSYSASFRDDFPNAIIHFLGYMEHIAKIPLEQADAGHVCYYMQYLKNNLKPNVEDWVKRVLTTPLDMFLNFLFGSGYCPGGMGEQQVKLATSPGGMGEQQVKLATSPSEPLHIAPIQKQCALTGTDPGLVFKELKDS